MSLLNSVLKAFVGDKAKKDVKELRPLVDQIHTYEDALSALSHDELRSKTQEFKDKIKASRADIDQRITELKAEAESSTDIDRNEDIYTEVDSLKEKGYEITEKVLAEILPEAFAVVKETA